MAWIFLLDSEEPSTGLIGSWSPGIGDPTFMGWLSVVLYFVAAGFAYSVWRGRRVRHARGEALCWGMLTLALMVLGINKQLDLQSAFTEIGRILANQQGWYAQRRELQRAFIGQVFIVLVIGLLVLAWLVRKSPRPTQVAMLGALLLAAFVVIRAASFHHVDLFINAELFGIRMNWVLEIGGISIILWAARRRLAASAPGARVSSRPAWWNLPERMLSRRRGGG